MTIKLMDHQQQWANDVLTGPYRSLLDSHGLLNASEAGTGKTHPMCQIATELIREFGGHAIFAVPTRLTWNWRFEFQQMCPHIPEVQLLVVGGSAADRERQKKYIEIFGSFTNLFVFVGYDALRIEQQFFQNMEDVTILTADECFPPDAPVQTETGVRQIKDVKVGDYVWSYNHWAKVMELKPVARTIKRMVRGHTNPLIIVKHQRGTITCTPNHKVLTQHGYVEAQDLLLFDKLFASSIGGNIIQVPVLEITETNRQVGHIHNLEVQDNHNMWLMGL